MGNDLRQGAQGHHRRQPRMCTMVHGPSSNGYGENCAARGDLVKISAPSGPEGGTFEGSDGVGFAGELVGLPSG